MAMLLQQGLRGQGAAGGAGRARTRRVRATHPAMRRRVRLGEWFFPSGQSMVACLEPDRRDGLRYATCAWDAPPPLRPDDLVHYLVVVRPALIRRAQEFLETPGRVLVLT
jgi:hypothetical protein